MVLHTDGRTDTDVIAKTKFLASIGYHIFLPMVLRVRAFGARSSATLGFLYADFYCIQHSLKSERCFRILIKDRTVKCFLLEYCRNTPVNASKIRIQRVC